MHTNRRQFIKTSLLAGTGLVLPFSSYGLENKHLNINFGIIADVHKDVIHDADHRLQTFINAASKRPLDFIIQMGDFCVPRQRNQGFMDIWNQYDGEKHHVLGNHDTDGGYNQSEVKAFWGMDSNYYAFDKGGVHWVVLDGNNKNPKPWQGYNRYIDKTQQDWLREDLRKTNKPTIIFSHQTLELSDLGVANAAEIQDILTTANKEAGFQKVLCCICGHNHTDFMTQIDGIYYVQINSSSYYWVGGKFKTIRYSKAIDKKYPWIKYTIPYADPLFTFVKVRNNKIIISPKKTTFVGPSPEDMPGLTIHPHAPIHSYISKYKMSFK